MSDFSRVFTLKLYRIFKLFSWKARFVEVFFFFLFAEVGLIVKLIENDMLEIDATIDAQLLVEDLAIEVVIALLGLEKPYSDPSSFGTFGSS